MLLSKENIQHAEYFVAHSRVSKARNFNFSYQTRRQLRLAYFYHMTSKQTIELFSTITRAHMGYAREYLASLAQVMPTRYNPVSNEPYDFYYSTYDELDKSYSDNIDSYDHNNYVR